MRRALAAALGAAACAAAAAGAATITGTSGNDVLRGTPRADVLVGLGGNDRLSGRGGNDFLWGGDGRDLLDGGAGADRLKADDGAGDLVACGAGFDTVSADAADAAGRDCEVVSRVVHRDRDAGGRGQFATTAEPDTFAWDSTVVASFQVGRIAAGAADAIGFATSTDAGARWRSGLLPGVSERSPAPGEEDRISDPSVAYDAAHGVWLVSTLGVDAGFSSLPVSRSRDGLRWSAPVRAAVNRGPGLAYDKNWIACDNWATSPFRGRCYLAYTELADRRIVVQSSDDGGLTWRRAVPVPLTLGGQAVVGAIPVSRPNGELLVVHLSGRHVVSARSTDGGASFAVPDAVATFRMADVPGVRAFPLPTVDVDAAGIVYVAWHDCRFRAGCSANDIVLAVAYDGRTWRAPARVPAVARGSRATAFIPGLVVSRPVGGPLRLAVVYYAMPVAGCGVATCRIDAYLVTSPNGRTWKPPRRLNAQSAQLRWIPQSAGGRMLGDYLSASFAGGRVTAAFPFPSPPRPPAQFDQPMFAVSLAP